LVATLRAIAPVLEVEGILVVGSEVPNLLEPRAAASLVVSQDVDIGVAVESHEDVKRRLQSVHALRPSEEEPSVWIPASPELIEVNFVGLDAALRDASESYVIDDPQLPLMVFGDLALLRPGGHVDIDGLRVPVPRPAGLLLEKLLTDRSAEKGDRDRLVALGLLLVSSEDDVTELVETYRTLEPDRRHAVGANLTMLSLMRSHPGMPDPLPQRARIAELLRRMEPSEP
jgi:hypothetical protein